MKMKLAGKEPSDEEEDEMHRRENMTPTTRTLRLADKKQVGPMIDAASNTICSVSNHSQRLVQHWRHDPHGMSQKELVVVQCNLPW